MTLIVVPKEVINPLKKTMKRQTKNWKKMNKSSKVSQEKWAVEWNE